MAFPILEDTTTTLFTTDSDDPLVIDLPATINSGDLLIMFVGLSEPRNNTVPVGWTRIVNNSSSERIMIFTRFADGLEGSTVNVDLASPSNSAVIVARISGAQGGVEIESLLTGTNSSTPDPPSITATFGSADNLFISGFSIDVNTSVMIPISAPSGYSNLTNALTNVGGGDDSNVSIATLNKSSDTEDPGTFSVGASTGWFAFTIAVEGTPGNYTGNFSPDSTAVEDANVYLTVSDDEAFTNGETYYTTTDVNGDWTIAQSTDPTKFVRVDIDYDDAGTRKQVSFYYDPT